MAERKERKKYFEVPARYTDCKYLRRTLNGSLDCECLKALYCAFEHKPCFQYKSTMAKRKKPVDVRTAFFKEDD